jgi:two-component system, chemotaxis family, protein-glutamate methylesterase/glutaminase
MSSHYVLDKPDHLTCPECGGALTKVEGDPITKYRCHIGHVLTGEAMLVAQAERIEMLLETALAALNEHRELCRELLEDGVHDGKQISPILRKATTKAEMLRDLLNDRPLETA